MPRPRSLENVVTLRSSGFQERDGMTDFKLKEYSLFLALVFCQICRGFALQKPSVPEAANLVVTGLLVCLDETLKETTCAATSEILGIKATSGKIYPLKKHDNVHALLVEKRLQTREFRLTLRKEEAPSPWFELVKSQFIRGGKAYDFYYFCEVCNI